ncbi:hypothetical protein AC578_8206 [Pseudocercospora eumusae]|uniref:Uncharacterized protein n=1 Tax=Pseudocercospora eumusae TaxID=321146 RepID=A0A139HF23_9PEZI|nr:hypothetical protein AC578_8206 [Pseudocercospora eumusae]
MASTHSFFMSIPIDLRYLTTNSFDSQARIRRQVQTFAYAQRSSRTSGDLLIDEKRFQFPLFNNRHTDIAYVTVPGLFTRRWLPDRWPGNCHPMPSKSMLLSPNGRGIKYGTESRMRMDITAWAREGYETQGSMQVKDACLDQRESILREVAERFEVYSKLAPQQYQPHALNVWEEMRSEVEVWRLIRNGHYLVY